MSWVDLHKAIRDAAIVVDDANSTIPFTYDNLPDAHVSTNTQFVRFIIDTGATRQVEITGVVKPRERTPGIARAEIYTEVEKGGTKSAHTLAESLRTAFSRVTLIDAGGNTVRFFAAQVRQLGRTEDGKWWQINVVCPFYYDD